MTLNDQEQKYGEPAAPGREPRKASPLRILPEEARPESSSLEAAPRLSSADVRERLKGKSGRNYWRSLDELAQSADFEDMLHREFPRQASEWDEGVSRRRFLQLSAAGLSLAGLTACTRQPSERIVPYVKQPEEIVPGRSLYFATASVGASGYATGLLVENHQGRPIKVEGNQDHPASKGSAGAIDQAGILELYDPDRSRNVLHLGRASQWSSLTAALEPLLAAQQAVGGEDLRILTGAVTSPTFAAQMEAVQQRFPSARWHQWDPAGGVSREGARQAFGDGVETHYDLSRAQVILTLDSDFLSEGPGHLRYARDFAAARKVHETDGKMSRMYSVESTPSPTGAMADHRLPLAASEIGHFASALAAELGVAGARKPSGGFSSPDAEAWVTAVAEDLRAHGGSSLVVPGAYTSPALQVLAYAINQALGNIGATVVATDAVAAQPAGGAGTLEELVEDMNAGKVSLLFILDSNPLFTAPASLRFADAIQKVGMRVHLGGYADETAEYCQWHVPMSHWLEAWSDARAYDGTVSIVQPLIEPLYESKSIHQVVAVLTGETGYSGYETVQRYWQSQGLGEAAWRKALHDGIVEGSALPAKGASVVGGAVSRAVAQLEEVAPAQSGALELTFRPDPSIVDGRYANNGWLQEVPKPLTKLTWDNALMISPADVDRLGLAGEMDDFHLLPQQVHGEEKKAQHLLEASGKMVRVTAGDQSLEVPLWVLPGQAHGTLTLHLGYGRRRAGAVGTGTGFDAYQLQGGDSHWHRSGVTVELAGGTYDLASTQRHSNIPVESEEAHDRHLVRTATLADFLEHPEVIEEMGHAEMAKHSFYPGYEYNDYRWGMIIDLNSCIGCNACVVACQAENNIPVVGKEQVARGREMHWMRIDRYYEGGVDNPSMHQQPVTCMQCEQAPCELVCPVAATVHNQHGLNDMVYNRCVGTRYCSNNCPYKVRRFNFLLYNKSKDPVVAMGRNPEVTVRSRGVMEKCTYCVQRISNARIDAEVEGRRVGGDEIKTACQQSCPADAIVFGDLNQDDSRVAQWKGSPLNYSLLEELGTRPRTTYLAKLRNPNPALESEEGSHDVRH
jgi:molybdopterin-containing oxidoreductase family iron-sulfur binding subunit